ncbi:sulfhydryl oxidase [Schizopora paradoxa]|uniref:Sulfhydryl oxidase n=1 Tax=Schizopora paradoxa TaxID=27342 RepID=A0A0H2R5M5_9AGAM|nr:sulfhydryl oxidase [Schizopora paradoxa]
MSALASGSSTSTTKSTARPDEPPEGCPPDVEQLGRATWTFLHTTAAYFPENPTPIQRTRMLGLLMALPVLYPCSYCAQHLGERINAHPPDLRGGRVSLSRWLCERHNEVNERLGKPLFNCSIKSTDERWKDGPSDGRCD